MKFKWAWWRASVSRWLSSLVTVTYCSASRGRSRSIYMRIQLTRRMVTVAISSEII
jgi:hypothetical protein